MKQRAKQPGFTIVELLIVIVVIAILAAITVVAYTGIQERAKTSKIESDLTTMYTAIIAARDATGKTMLGVTLNGYTSANCRNGTVADGTDLSTLSQSHTCWATYNATLDRISTAAGIDIRGMVDPWGWPYHIDENEGEGGNCNRDNIGTFSQPLNAYAAGSADGLPVSITTYGNSLIPLSGYSGCA